MKQFLHRLIVVSIFPVVVMMIAFIGSWQYAQNCLDSYMYDCGDLSRLGNGDVFDRAYSPRIMADTVSYERSHFISIDELAEIDTNSILIIGDSYSRVRMSRFQNALADCLQYTINTLDFSSQEPVSTTYNILKKSSTLPRIIILETVERHFIERLQDYKIDIPFADIKVVTAEKKSLYHYSRQYYDRKLYPDTIVKHTLLKVDAFSCPNKGSDLFFYYLDLVSTTDIEEQRAYENLKELHAFAESKNVQLFFMVAANKYSVYQDFIKNNPYPCSNLLSNSSIFNNLPYFINTRPALVKAVKNGTKDVYHVADTHWSPVGASIVTQQLYHYFKNLGLASTEK